MIDGWLEQSRRWSWGQWEWLFRSLCLNWSEETLAIKKKHSLLLSTSSYWLRIGELPMSRDRHVCFFKMANNPALTKTCLVRKEQAMCSACRRLLFSLQRIGSERICLGATPACLLWMLVPSSRLCRHSAAVGERRHGFCRSQHGTCDIVLILSPSTALLSP